MLDGSKVFFTLWPALGEWLISNGFQERAVPAIDTHLRVWLPRRQTSAVDAATLLPCGA
jgi:hypothetical protein